MTAPSAGWASQRRSSLASCGTDCARLRHAFDTGLEKGVGDWSARTPFPGPVSKAWRSRAQSVPQMPIWHDLRKNDSFSQIISTSARNPSDIGSACIVNSGSAWVDYAVTRYYRAPEIVQYVMDDADLLGHRILRVTNNPTRRYDHRIDLWSIGCILAECIIGNPLFPGYHNIPFPSFEQGPSQMQLIFQTCGSPKAERIDKDDFFFNAGGIPKNSNWKHNSWRLARRTNINNNWKPMLNHDILWF